MLCTKNSFKSRARFYLFARNFHHCTITRFSRSVVCHVHIRSLNRLSNPGLGFICLPGIFTIALSLVSLVQWSLEACASSDFQSAMKIENFQSDQEFVKQIVAYLRPSVLFVCSKVNFN